MMKAFILMAVLVAVVLGSGIMERRVSDLPCGNYTLTNRTRIIVQSPNFPQRYPPNYSCEWEISCPDEDAHYLHFKCPHFKLEYSPLCINDRLLITARGESTARCGTNSPNDTYTTTGWTRLGFRSNALFVEQGFRCYIWCHAY